jgi:hypothetical protein
VVREVGEEQLLAAADEGGREDGHDFVAALLDDVDRLGVLAAAGAEVALWHEYPKSGILHPLHDVHREVLGSILRSQFFGDFCQFSGKNGIFLKTNNMIQFLHK